MSPKAQFAALLVSLGSAFFILRLVRRRRLRAKYAFLWVSIAVAGILLAVAPGTFDRVSRALGVSYGPALLFSVAILVLLLVVIHFSYELSRLEDRTRALAEQFALLGLALRRDGAAPVEPGPGDASGSIEARLDAMAREIDALRREIEKGGGGQAPPAASRAEAGVRPTATNSL